MVSVHPAHYLPSLPSPVLQSETPVSRASRACSDGSTLRSQGSSEGSSGCDPGLQAADSEVQGGTPCWDAASDADGEAEAEREYTVVHNGMIITHVPASEVSKVGLRSHYQTTPPGGKAQGRPLQAVLKAQP